ncbi:Conserved_hypothetical protein [Hexamita inflata]|uniref:Uncharacterized protein n=1 Tax=Hexamita inflata TaxID=28002 RepID=A0ABP1I8L4_9EUKA
MTSEYSKTMSRASSMSITDSIEQDLAMSPVIQLFLQFAIPLAIQTVMNAIVNIFVVEVVIYYSGLENAAFLCFIQPLVDLLTQAIPQAVIYAIRQPIIGFIFQKHGKSANIFFSYAFVCTVIFIAVTSIPIINSSFSAVFTADSEQKYYMQVMIATACVSRGLYYFLINALKLDSQISHLLGVDIFIQFASASIMVIAVLKDVKALKILAISLVIVTISANIFLFVRRTTYVETYSFKITPQSFQPVQPKILGQIIVNTLKNIPQAALEPLLSVFILQGFEKLQDEFTTHLFQICFQIFRYLSTIANSFNQAARNFAQTFFETNVRIGNAQRVYSCFLQCMIVLFGVQVVLAGMVYWLCPFIQTVLFQEAKYKTFEYDLINDVFRSLKMSILAGFTQAGFAFVDPLIHVQHMKQFIVLQQVIEYLYVFVLVIVMFTSKTRFNWIEAHAGWQCLRGVLGWAQYIVICLKLHRNAKLKQEVIEPLMDIQDNIEHEPQLVLDVISDGGDIRRRFLDQHLSSELFDSKSKKLEFGSENTETFNSLKKKEQSSEIILADKQDSQSKNSSKSKD